MNPAHLGIGMTSQRTRERLVQRLREEGIQSSGVLEAIRTMPRHIFVDEALASRAYEDTALPIGYGQTISQPYVVARMSEALLPVRRLANVLEIGTGSGYQTAILAHLVTRVFSVERIGALLRRARARFAELGLRNIHLKHGDGHLGWPERAPFDGILVTAAPAEVPQGLLGQLSIGGRLVLPLGNGDAQELAVITRTRLGFQKARLERVSFVPLRGGTA